MLFRQRHHRKAHGPRRGLLSLLGPGLITGASDDDSSGIATYSQAGAQFSYSLTWVMLFTRPLMAANPMLSGSAAYALAEAIGSGGCTFQT